MTWTKDTTALKPMPCMQARKGRCTEWPGCNATRIERGPVRYLQSLASSATTRAMLHIGATLLLAVTSSAACQSDLDCSLNGICSTNQTCTCDAPWGGAACELLIRGPTRVTGGGIYGYAPNVTSWGGNVIRDGGGTWHLYASEMAGAGCGLHVWGGQSTVVHATATTVEGPFTKRTTVIASEAHNPQAMVINGSWYIFHIGTGDKSGAPKDCNETARAPATGPAVDTLLATVAVAAGAGGGSTLHRAPAPDGPFQPVPGAPSGCNNPSPARHPNGTLYLFCTWSIRASQSGTPEGPWDAPVAVHPPTSKARHWEDPFLWIDARGHFHVLSHTWSALPYPSNAISGHAFSIDGGAGSWQFSAAEPYDNLVRHADGTVQSFATLERPKLLFADPKRPHTPTHLINGASPVWLDGPDPCAVCGPTGEVHCSHCKQQPGIDWTYTLMTPLVPP